MQINIKNKLNLHELSILIFLLSTFITTFAEQKYALRDAA
jgi:hypothetical protein